MGEIVSLAESRPHIAGLAKCLACEYEWAAVAQVGTLTLDCPKCGCQRGVLKYPIIRDGDHWTCHCGNWAFVFTRIGTYCPNCGDFQKGF